MFQFVILWHEMPPEDSRASHWDLMLEDGARLRTWALPQLPQLDQQMVVDSLPDHRLAYLDCEGPVSGSRGHITRWDRGELEWVARDAERIVAVLRGQRIRAQVRLTLDPTTQRWFFDASSLDSADCG